MFYKGELDGLLTGIIDDLPLILAVDFGLGTAAIVCVHPPNPAIMVSYLVSTAWTPACCRSGMNEIE